MLPIVFIERKIKQRLAIHKFVGDHNLSVAYIAKPSGEFRDRARLSGFPSPNTINTDTMPSALQAMANQLATDCNVCRCSSGVEHSIRNRMASGSIPLIGFLNCINSNRFSAQSSTQQ